MNTYWAAVLGKTVVSAIRGTSFLTKLLWYWPWASRLFLKPFSGGQVQWGGLLIAFKLRLIRNWFKAKPVLSASSADVNWCKGWEYSENTKETFGFPGVCEEVGEIIGKVNVGKLFLKSKCSYYWYTFVYCWFYWYTSISAPNISSKIISGIDAYLFWALSGQVTLVFILLVL